MRKDAQQQLPLSVAIIAYNEEDRIEDVIRSVQGWVQEIIVVDSHSQDKTPLLAKKLGAKVFQNPWPGYGPQKRFAEDQCSQKWILNLDADERVSTALKEDLQALFAHRETMVAGYKIPIREVFPHQQEPSFWAPAITRTRLYDKTKGRFRDSAVNDLVDLPSSETTKTLKGAIWHASMRSFSHTIYKNNLYTDAQMASSEFQARRPSGLRLLVEFPLSFCNAYFLKKWCFGGLYGFCLSMIYAFSKFQRLAKLYEKNLAFPKRRR